MLVFHPRVLASTCPTPDFTTTTQLRVRKEALFCNPKKRARFSFTRFLADLITSHDLTVKEKIPGPMTQNGKNSPLALLSKKRSLFQQQSSPTHFRIWKSTLLSNIEIQFHLSCCQQTIHQGLPQCMLDTRTFISANIYSCAVSTISVTKRNNHQGEPSYGLKANQEGLIRKSIPLPNGLPYLSGSNLYHGKNHGKFASCIMGRIFVRLASEML